jgi:hypothetical protein
VTDNPDPRKCTEISQEITDLLGERKVNMAEAVTIVGALTLQILEATQTQESFDWALERTYDALEVIETILKKQKGYE